MDKSTNFIFNGPNPASFCFFPSFHNEKKNKYSRGLTLNETNVDGGLGIQTQGSRKKGTDKSTVL